MCWLLGEGRPPLPAAFYAACRALHRRPPSTSTGTKALKHSTSTPQDEAEPEFIPPQ
ncbi:MULTISPECIES: hypothetical protein [unclassified Lentimonas]|uniref:hypothetical protein n=1 Tax=unclassified Lentimonas TaxID=2630993 RepID=UPI00138A6C6F|nr:MULTISPECIES: hypothetical protein [unclassified Lentimonas]